MSLNRQQISQLYRKRATTPMFSTTFDPAAPTPVITPNNQFDLSVPLALLRFVIKGRLVVGTAGLATSYPHGLLGLVSRIWLYGMHSRLGGQATLYDMPLSTLWDFQHLTGLRQGSLIVNSSVVAVPSTPYPATYNPANNTGTYDFILRFELPFYPFGSPELVRPGYLVRSKDWKQTLALRMEFGTQAGGSAVHGFLGINGTSQTNTWTGYASGAGKPSIDIYGIPLILGEDVAPKIANTGLLVRVAQPVNSPLINGIASGGTLLQLQNRNTPRIYVQNGTLVSGETEFTTLSDTNLTAIGLQFGGGSKIIRPNVDIWAVKQDAETAYGRDPIQGSLMFDFIESQNPDSALPADATDGNASLNLIGTATGVANGYGLIVQEQQLLVPDGELYAA